MQNSKVKITIQNSKLHQMNVIASVSEAISVGLPRLLRSLAMTLNRERINTYRFLILMLLFVFGIGFLSYKATHALFSDAALSQNNTFTAAEFFSSPTPSPTPTPDLSGIANHVVISEAQIATEGASTSDFIELYNPTSDAVNLDPFRLVKRTSSGSTDDNIISFTSDDIIPAHGFYLWASSDGGFNLQIGADVSTTENIAANNSIALRDGALDTGTIIDALGWGSPGGTQLTEGTAAVNPGNGQGIERKALSSSDTTSMESGADVLKGNGFDSNDNTFDFILRSVSQPQNSSSATEMP